MEREPFLEVPLEALSPEAVRGLVEAFVGREGTDYGERECSLEEKVQDVLGQLERGEARIVFDGASETTHIVLARELRAR